MDFGQHLPTCLGLLFSWILWRLQLESHLSMRSFCDALGYMSRFRIHDIKEVKDLYRAVVGDSSNEYRFHRTLMSSGRHLQCNIDSGSCPACSKTTGKKIICVDANFGLVHKRSAGIQGLTDSRHSSDNFIHVQAEVDEFVTNYQDSKKNDGCASFQAGSAVRSKIKNSKLDMTGVFGSVCKHDHPLKLCNLRHGERLAYSVHHLESYLKESGDDQQVIFMYDIACMLHKHLMILYGQRHVEGTGLTDGEGTERLWSFLRRFSKITKEMTLSNRQDLLVDALYHFSKKLNNKLCERIVSRYTKALRLKELTVENLQKKTDKGMDEVKNLYEERKRSANTNHSRQGDTALSTEEEYSWFILQASRLRMELEKENSSEEIQNKLAKELDRTESQLIKLEKKAKIIQRWDLTDVQFKTFLESYREKRKTVLKKQMKQQAVERLYLLSLMKKYADGQEISIRLGKQLQTVNQKLKTQIKELNGLDQSATKLEFKDVSDVSSEFYSDDDSEEIQDRNKILDLYSSLLRADEELEYSKQDMNSTLLWIFEQQNVIHAQISILEFGSSTRKSKGEINLLLLLKMELENWLQQAAGKFSPYINVDTETLISPVTEFVIQCLNGVPFEESLPSEELTETLELIGAFETEANDDQIENEIEEENFSDEEQLDI